MTEQQFLDRLPPAVRNATKPNVSRSWYIAYNYIVRYGQTDRHDEDFIAEMAKVGVKATSIPKLLAKLASLGIIAKHRVVARYAKKPGKGSALFNALFGHTGPSAGAYNIFSPPGLLPILKTKKDADK